MKKLWATISDTGCHDGLEQEERRRLQLMNRLNFISLIVLLIYLAIELVIHVYVFVPPLLIMVVLVLITFFLLHRRAYNFAKHYAVLVIACCIGYFTLATGEAFSEALLIPLSVMPLLIFRCRETALTYLGIMIALLLGLRCVLPYVEPVIHLEGSLLSFFRTTNIVSGLAITFAITYYFKRDNERYESQLVMMNSLMTEKNTEIMDSINYARHIQSAIIPSPDHFLRAFPHSFILYRPKDVVAGDFYWLYEEQTNGANYVYFAAADCTGHGVPGAMVSVVCSNALNRAVKEFRLTEPGAILDRARELVAETFSRNQEEIRDGMDLALCRLDRDSGELLYAGANNPLWLYTSEGFREIKADKQPVGRSESSKPFTTKLTQLQAGDSIYLFTDGYADQFGGEKGKKFKYSRFRDLLGQISPLSPAEQQLRISQELDSWKGKLEQVDDILVLGIRL